MMRKTVTRAAAAVALGYLNWRAQRMTDQLPTVAGVDLERVAADGGADDMVLMNADGTLTLDPTPDDIATYQVPGRWPRYICRVSTVASLLRRADAETAAAQLNAQIARQFAMDTLTGPHATPAAAAPPGNAPVRTGTTSVTIQ